MISPRSRLLRYPALVLPAALLWVVAACLRQCAAAAACARAAEPACCETETDADRPSPERAATPAASCPIAIPHWALRPSGPAQVLDAASPAAPFSVETPVGYAAPSRARAKPPPASRPLDRLPVLLI